MSFRRQLLARKSLDTILAEMEGGENRLKRALGPINLTALGIGAVIGAGIFVTTGEAAHHTAGPRLDVVVRRRGNHVHVCGAVLRRIRFDGAGRRQRVHLCLHDARRVVRLDHRLGPVLEYAVGAATVANGWSSYFQAVVGQVDNVLRHWHFLSEHATLNLPLALRSAPLKFVEDPHSIMGGDFVATGAYINLPAVLIVAIITMILVKGIQESAGFNAVMVAIKIAAVLFVIVVGAFYINPANWHPLRTLRMDRRQLLRSSRDGADVAGWHQAAGNAGRVRRLFSSPISASTPFRHKPRKRRTRSETCRLGLSRR